MDDKPTNIIRAVRNVMPVRAVTLSEAYALAELQANKLLGYWEVHGPAVDVSRITQLPRVNVVLRPRHEMPNLAGFTQWEDGRYLIVINKNNNVGRRRFTLVHETKHVLDWTLKTTAYRRLGQGSANKRDKQIEYIADYFAACVLMPRRWVKHYWASGLQDPEALAGLFRVSLQAMTTRLTYLGFLEDDQRPTISYFRYESRTILAAQGDLRP
jgi:Zn-dependent peptidase ImmA (M78 family)